MDVCAEFQMKNKMEVADTASKAIANKLCASFKEKKISSFGSVLLISHFCNYTGAERDVLVKFYSL